MRIGRYEVLRTLGEGGQGVVHLARTPGGEQVALKVLRNSDPRTLSRLDRELRAVRAVAPFCTARIIEVVLDEADPYIVTEFIDGPSLSERVSAQGPIRGGELDRLLIGTATALAAIHGAGVVHRDFKPANILLGPDGPRVVDFGIAKPEDATAAHSGLVGTPGYLAPEQLHGSPASPASDVFAWAATMVFAASAHGPFGNDSMAAVFNRILHHPPDLSGIPPHLLGTLSSCLAKDPAARPTAESLLLGLVNPRAAREAPQPTSPLDAPAARRSRKPAVALMTAIAAAALVTALVVNAQNDDPGSPVQTPDQTSAPARATNAIPDALDGTWAGNLNTDAAGKPQLTVFLKLKKGQGGGTWTTPGCTDQPIELKLVSPTGAVTFARQQTSTCLSGDFTVTRRQNGELDVIYDEPGGGVRYTGVLAKP